MKSAIKKQAPPLAKSHLTEIEEKAGAAELEIGNEVCD
jgi:hypothetical protein